MLVHVWAEIFVRIVPFWLQLPALSSCSSRLVIGTLECWRFYRDGRSFRRDQGGLNRVERPPLLPLEGLSHMGSNEALICWGTQPQGAEASMGRTGRMGHMGRMRRMGRMGRSQASSECDDLSDETCRSCWRVHSRSRWNLSRRECELQR